MDDYENDIKIYENYLKENNVEFDYIEMWQSGFGHEGTRLGLPIMVTLMNNGKREIYCVPKAKFIKNPPPKFLKTT